MMDSAVVEKIFKKTLFVSLSVLLSLILCFAFSHITSTKADLSPPGQCGGEPNCPLGCCYAGPTCNKGCPHGCGGPISDCPQWKSCYWVGSDCVKDCDYVGYCNWDYCPGGCGGNPPPPVANVDCGSVTGNDYVLKNTSYTYSAILHYGGDAMLPLYLYIKAKPYNCLTPYTINLGQEFTTWPANNTAFNFSLSFPANGQYNVFCAATVGGYGTCYGACLADGVTTLCPGVGSSKIVTVVDSPSATVTGPVSICQNASANYTNTLAPAGATGEIWKSLTSVQSWDNIRPLGGAGTSSTTFNAAGTWYVVANSFAYGFKCSGNPWCTGNKCPPWFDCGASSRLTVTVLPIVNGVCSATHYGCTVGTSVNNVQNPTTWTWNCNGSCGGTNASCSENRSNNPPTCTIAGNSTVPTLGTVALTGSGSDPDGDMVSGSIWSATGGSVSPITGLTTTWTAPNVVGSYTITLKVIDGRGGTGTCTKVINTTNRPPTCTIAGNSTVPTAGTVALTGNGVDPEGGPITYTSWSATGGSVSPAAGQNVTWTAPNVVGSYMITLTVTDNLGATGTCLKAITTTNRPPTCTIAGNSTVFPNGTVALTGNGIDPDGTISSYNPWVVLGGSMNGTVNPTSGQTTTYTAPGTTGFYTVQLTVRDNLLALGTCTKSIQVIPLGNNPPTCTIAGPSKVIVGGTAGLIGTGSDGDGSIISYNWMANGGNLNPISGPNTAWTAPLVVGSYIITLTVMDDDLATGQCTKGIDTTAPALTCTSITGPTSMIAGGSASYTAVSSGLGGLTYVWSAAGGTFSNTASNPTIWTAPLNIVGSFTLNVTVKDTYGNITACPAKVVTTTPNIDCVNITGPSSMISGGSGQYTAITSGPVVSYAWTKTGGTFSSTSANPTWWTSPAGSSSTYTLNVSVGNAQGLTDSCPVFPVVVGANTPPSCTQISGSPPNPATLYFGTPADLVNLTAVASDSDGIKSYAWFSTPVSGTFSSTSSNPTSWTPTLNTAATYLINTTITDNLGASSTCPNFTVNVKPTFDLTVGAGAKPDTNIGICGGSLTSLLGAWVTVRTVEAVPVLVGSGPTGAAGTIIFTGIKRNKQLDICVTAPAQAGCTSYTADSTCPLPEHSVSGCSRITPPGAGNLSKTFEFSQSTGAGWVTAIDGDTEADALGNKMACTGYYGELNPPNGFKAFLVNFSNDASTDPKAYVFSNNLGGNTISTNNILEDTARGGWAFKLGATYGYLSELTYKAPGTWFQTVTNLNGSGTGLYKMTATDFNNLSSTYTLSCGGCRAGILYVEGSGSDKVKFKNSFTTTGSPLLIVTALPVVVSSGVGIPPTVGTGNYNFPITSTPSIRAAIVGSDTITVESIGINSSENVVMLQGPLVSLKQINFNRDVGVQNAKTPAEAVKYDPIFLCETSKLEKAHPEYKSYTGLGIFSVQWDYSE